MMHRTIFHCANFCKNSMINRMSRNSFHNGLVAMHDHHHDDDHLDEDHTDKIEIRWKDKNGKLKITHSKPGLTLLNIARANEIDLEGACEGVCACSTCHVILEKKIYDSLAEPSEDEEDMLDQAFGLTSTSRLGCQVVVTRTESGMEVQLPKATRNFYVVSRK